MNFYIKKKKSFRVRPEPPFNSQLEKKIYNKFRKSLSKNVKILVNVRGLLEDKKNKKLELDLYFPEYKIGIEIQGGNYHSEKIENIVRDYRKKKLFLKKGIRVMYVFTGTNATQSHCIKKCLQILNHECKK